MMTVVTGGSGSGKSAYAEALAAASDASRRVYLATMIPWDEECRQRIQKHRRQRADKGFVTVERFLDLEGWEVGDGDLSVLLDCVSNLAANEFYRKEEAGLFGQDRVEAAVDRVMRGIRRLREAASDLVVVTNEVFSDSASYDPETCLYRQALGEINQGLASLADRLVEVVCGIPVLMKGGETR